MLSIAELAHKRDPEAIAAIIRQELQPLDIERLEVEVTIVDSSLELQVRTDSAIDKEKLLTLVRGELQNLQIESVAKFRIHNWRNDPEMHEQRLLWTEQFMLDSPKSSPVATPSHGEIEPDKLRSPETRPPEPQLSKHSVLQQAIAKIALSNPQAKANLLDAELNPQSRANANNANNGAANTAIVLNTNRKKQSPAAFEDNYWHLLLVGLSIVLLGLGIGAAVKALTFKGVNEVNSSAATSVSNNSVKDAATAKISSSKDIDASSASKNSSLANRSSTSEVIAPTTNIANPATNTSPIAVQEEEQVITLEKFNRIQKGMTIEQVEKIFGASGKVIAENNSSNSIGRVYSWKNPQGSNAIIEFKDGQVVAKAQAGL